MFTAGIIQATVQINESLSHPEKIQINRWIPESRGKSLSITKKMPFPIFGKGIFLVNTLQAYLH